MKVIGYFLIIVSVPWIFALCSKEWTFCLLPFIRKDRMKGCDWSSENEMKKMGRGTHRYKCDLNSGLVIVRWHDNNV